MIKFSFDLDERNSARSFSHDVSNAKCEMSSLECQIENFKIYLRNVFSPFRKIMDLFLVFTRAGLVVPVAPVAPVNPVNFCFEFNLESHANNYYAPTLRQLNLRTEEDARDADNPLFYLSASTDCSVNLAPFQDGLILINQRPGGQEKILQKLR